jgi:hypothetical protein
LEYWQGGESPEQIPPNIARQVDSLLPVSVRGAKRIGRLWLGDTAQDGGGFDRAVIVMLAAAVAPVIGKRIPFRNLEADRRNQAIPRFHVQRRNCQKFQLEVVVNPSVESNLGARWRIQHGAVADILAILDPLFLRFGQFALRDVGADQWPGIDADDRNGTNDIKVPVHKPANGRRLVKGPGDPVLAHALAQGQIG